LMSYEMAIVLFRNHWTASVCHSVHAEYDNKLNLLAICALM